jgi:hypothetical protein
MVPFELIVVRNLISTGNVDVRVRDNLAVLDARLVTPRGVPADRSACRLVKQDRTHGEREALGWALLSLALFLGDKLFEAKSHVDTPKKRGS